MRAANLAQRSVDESAAPEWNSGELDRSGLRDYDAHITYRNSGSAGRPVPCPGIPHPEAGVTPEQILTSADSILVIDWPSRDVPETLTRAGYTVLVKGGPEPDNFSAWQLRDGEVVVAKLGRAPAHVDIVYAHRPAGDPTGVWLPDEEANQARAIVEQGGLHYVNAPYIADLVRELRP